MIDPLWIFVGTGFVAGGIIGSVFGWSQGYDRGFNEGNICGSRPWPPRKTEKQLNDELRDIRRRVRQ